MNVSAADLAPLVGEVFEPDVEGGSFNAAAFTTLFSPDSFLNGYNGDNVFPTTYVAANPDLILDVVSLDSLVDQFGFANSDSTTFTIEEDTFAAYAQADFGFLDDRLTGNVGLRYIDTDQTSLGNLPDLSQLVFTQQGAATLTPVVTPQEVNGDYSEWLPSANLKFDITDNLVARFAAATTITRAPLNRLSPATSINLNIGQLISSNPDLGPQKADQLDFSVEWYFGEGGLLSASYFDKDITDTIIEGQGAPITLNGTLLESGDVAQFEVTPFFPENADETVNINGFEVAYQQPFTFLPAPFDGFGVIANYTFVDVPDVPLADVSEDTYNIVGYYENDKFSARLAYNFRSEFATPGSNFFGDGSNTEEFGQFDASVNYRINDNFSAVIEGINITEATTEFVNDIGFNRGVEDTGRRILFGVRGSF